jgi:hypothetical protein
LAVLVGASVVFGADSLPQLTTRVATIEGKPVLEISGTAPDASDWLGASFYLPGCKDSTWEAEHLVYPVKGEFRVPVPVPAGFEKGTYEAALWRTKLGENTFYKPEWLRGYGTGSVAAGPVAVKLADSLSALATEVAMKDGRKALKVTGKAIDNRWLGVSFYKPNYADALLDGNYSMMSIAKGPFTQWLTVPSGYEQGTYEVALWGSVLARKKVFRLETILAYGAGRLEQ